MLNTLAKEIRLRECELRESHEMFHDPRLPTPGNVITRTYKGHEIIVKVLKDGFEFQGRIYRSLTAIADEVTGSHWSGYRFFGLPQRRRQRK